MVKVHGKNNSPGGFDFIPGATYVGDSRVLGLAIFVDQSDPSQILLRFDEQRPRRVNYKEFLRAVNFLEAFSSGEAQAYESPDPNPLKLSIVILESSRILLHWEESTTALFPLEFFQTLNILVAIRKKMEVIVRRELDRKARLAEGTFVEQFKNWGGLIVFIMLSALDLLMLICLVIWPQFFLHWLALTLGLAFWILVIKPAWAGRVWPTIQIYLDDELITDLSNLHFPKRSVEIFLILLILTFIYFFFGSDAANLIFKHYKGSSLP
ncbi:MAG: hypothetical protein CVV41_11800 [Candidatus Riflebacteria bacterium HGW-Riflebacteria-1]|jgi:hypothetical protein|nr:MAG: hypothetical protein CVV41_11800 [Candidatus Riflebacteria bacterium HGW-Riflebacteria-1]